MPISESKYRSRSFNFGHKEPQYRHLDATQDTTRLHDVVDTQIKPTYGSLAEEEHAFISSQDILRKSDPTKRFANVHLLTSCEEWGGGGGFIRLRWV